MSTNRSKTSHGKSTSRSSPNARIRGRRLHQQPIQGRYPVLPPIGHSWTPLAPYQTVGHQGFMIPAMTYPMPPYQQMVPYVPQSGFPMNMMFQSLPLPLPQPCMAAVPTSMMCYYVPWPGECQQTGSDNSITELPPDELVKEENDQRSECSFSYMHQALMYHDTVFLLKVCEEICSEVVESVVAELAKETVTSCIDEMVKSYLGQAHLLSASSLERPKPKLEEVRASTNPTPSRRQRQGVSSKEKQQLLLQPLTMQPCIRRVAGLDHSAKHAMAEPKMKPSTKEVAEHICLILLDELLFQQLLEVAVMGSACKTSEALAGSVLNELLFQECLKLALRKQSSSKASDVPV